MSQRKSSRFCSTDGCTKPVNARGMCSTHYSRWRHLNPGLVRTNPSRTGEMRACLGCGRDFYAPLAQLRTSEGAGSFCSNVCRSTKVVQVCDGCGTEFMAYPKRHRRFCSRACRKVTGLCAIPDCGEQATVRTMGSGGERRPLCGYHCQRTTIAKLYYGLTLDEDIALRAKGCAICGIHPEDGAYPYRRGLHIDHDHGSGKVREALCPGCNTGLGKFADDPARLRAAAEYLEKHRN